MVAIMKKNRKLGLEYLKTWVKVFQAGVFWVGIFQAGICQGGVWFVEISQVGIFRVGVFRIPKKIYAKNSQVYMHWHWPSSEKSSVFKLIASVFSPPPIITFFYGVEIFPHPLLQLTCHISALIRNTEM